MNETTAPVEPSLAGPLVRLKRWLAAHHMTLMTLTDTPHSIALGSAIGVFFGFTPLLSMKTLLSIAVAWLCKCSKIAAAIAVTLHDIILPLMPAIYFWQYKIGMRVLYGRTAHRLTFHPAFADFTNWKAFLRVGWPLLFGSLFLAVPCALATYVIMRMLVSRARSDQRALDQENAAAANREIELKNPEMNIHFRFGSILLMTMLAASGATPLDPNAATPPVAARKSKTVGLHGDKIDDPYFWLREKNNPEVIKHLKAENAYTAAVMAPFQTLEDSLYREMLGRIKQTDVSAPYLQRGYWLYFRTEEGKQYPVFCRKKETLAAPEEIVLDVNKLAQGKKFMALGAFEYSDDNSMLAYSTDVNGHRDYEFHLKKLATGEEIKTPIGKVASLLWAADNRTLFFITENKAKRAYQLWRYSLGEKKPTLLYQERDELFNLDLARSRDRKYLFLVAESSRTSEFRFLPAEKPKSEWTVLAPRRNEIKYYAEHREGTFYIRTNDGAKEYRVMAAPVESPGVEHWKEFIPAAPGITIEDFEPFAKHAVVITRQEGLTRFGVRDFATNETKTIELPEPAYHASEDENPEFSTGTFRFEYESPVTPKSIFEYDVASGNKKLLKQTEILGGYDPAKYALERVHAEARDGTKIPLDIVRRKDVAIDGRATCWLYGYGSYGLSIDPSFSSNLISLLDRGVIYAIAHIRGGGELGEAWHDDGRMMTKKNTFSDFAACGDYLVEKKYTRHDRMLIQGRSAGGLLIGATINLRPDLARVAILDVPFVDVLNTMSDPSLPLTTEEYIEWGNPAVKSEYDYIKTYSPYDNIVAKDYPTMLLFTSLNDSQVPYWEPAKFAAKLRATKSDQNPLLFKINLDAGHGGSSGRFDRLREIAFEYAFGLAALGVENAGNAAAAAP